MLVIGFPVVAMVSTRYASGSDKCRKFIVEKVEGMSLTFSTASLNSLVVFHCRVEILTSTLACV